MKKFHQNYKITKKLKRLNNYLLLQFQIQYLYQQLFRDAKRLFVPLLLLLFLFFSQQKRDRSSIINSSRP